MKKTTFAIYLACKIAAGPPAAFDVRASDGRRRTRIPWGARIIYIDAENDPRLMLHRFLREAQRHRSDGRALVVRVGVWAWLLSRLTLMSTIVGDSFLDSIVSRRDDQGNPRRSKRSLNLTHSSPRKGRRSPSSGRTVVPTVVTSVGIPSINAYSSREYESPYLHHGGRGGTLRTSQY